LIQSNERFIYAGKANLRCYLGLEDRGRQNIPGEGFKALFGYQEDAGSLTGIWRISIPVTGSECGRAGKSPQRQDEHCNRNTGSGASMAPTDDPGQSLYSAIFYRNAIRMIGAMH